MEIKALLTKCPTKHGTSSSQKAMRLQEHSKILVPVTSSKWLIALHRRRRQQLGRDITLSVYTEI
jgi:hypothetical protein